MSIRNPQTIEAAHAEIDKALDDLNRSQQRIKKAANFLIHYANTENETSAESHYAVSLLDSNPHYSRLRWALSDAQRAFTKASKPFSTFTVVGRLKGWGVYRTIVQAIDAKDAERLYREKAAAGKNHWEVREIISIKRGITT